MSHMEQLRNLAPSYLLGGWGWLVATGGSSILPPSRGCSVLTPRGSRGLTWTAVHHPGGRETEQPASPSATHTPGQLDTTGDLRETRSRRLGSLNATRGAGLYLEQRNRKPSWL